MAFSATRIEDSSTLERDCGTASYCYVWDVTVEDECANAWAVVGHGDSLDGESLRTRSQRLGSISPGETVHLVYFGDSNLPAYVGLDDVTCRPEAS